MTQTAKRLILTTATVASWMRRLNESGPSAITRSQEPVNKFPDFVRHIVQRLQTLCPTLGTGKMAQMLARAGLHLGLTTVRQMRHGTPSPKGPPAPLASVVKTISKRPNHVWLTDFTTVPTFLGLWTSWFPFCLPQRWPFCWWVAVVIDHYSRRVMGFCLFRQQPTSTAVTTFLERVIQYADATPRHLITDHGKQFLDAKFRAWSRRRGIRQRFGALGRYGSIALIERFMGTLKRECTRRLVVPYANRVLRTELALFTRWYNQERPHAGLFGGTPEETYRGLALACLKPRFEPRRNWTRAACGAAPHALRGRSGVRLDLRVAYFGGRKHLPIVTLQRAA